MPGMNQKGPEGAGPLTGGGWGICRRTVDAGGFGQGQGRGQGAGQGRRGGRGRCLVSGDEGRAPTEVVDALQRQIDANQKTLDALMTKVSQLTTGNDKEK